MAWNRIDNKSINPTGMKGASVPPGAPISTNPSFQGRAYRDPWDIERAYREGMQKVTWVSRCIDAIAGNQARLPIILRKDNSPDGEIVTKKQGKSTILDILNTKSNNNYCGNNKKLQKIPIEFDGLKKSLLLYENNFTLTY